MTSRDSSLEKAWDLALDDLDRPLQALIGKHGHMVAVWSGAREVIF
jgi:hypothetical protein